MQRTDREEKTKGDTDDTTPKDNKDLIHISQVKICIGGRYMTLEEIQEKARKEKPYEKNRED